MSSPASLAAEAFDPDELALGLHRRWLQFDDPALPPLPVLCWRGGPGRRLVVTAGIHGDEYEGPAAIWQLAEHVNAARLHGCLIALPCCNPWAAVAATRETPAAIDGLNLARSFPGDNAGRPTERLAYALFRLIRRLAGPDDLLADLHAGGVALEFLPIAGYRALPGPALDRSLAAARAFGLERLWRMAPHAGTLTDAASRAGIPSVGAEMPGAGGQRAEDVARYREGIDNLLRFQGILRDRPPPTPAATAHRTIDVLAVAEGHLLLEVAPGDRVDAGQVLGTVVSALGEPVAAVRVPCAGQLWAVRHLPRVRPGDLVAMVAVPAEDERPEGEVSRRTRERADAWRNSPICTST